MIRGREPTTETAAPLRLPADTVETAVVQEIRRIVQAPEIVARAVTAVRQDMPAIAERDVVAALDQFHDLWPALFPAEQARIVPLLVERVTVTGDGFALDLRVGVRLQMSLSSCGKSCFPTVSAVAGAAPDKTFGCLGRGLRSGIPRVASPRRPANEMRMVGALIGRVP